MHKSHNLLWLGQLNLIIADCGFPIAILKEMARITIEKLIERSI